MSQLNKSPNLIQDEQLADFTDRVLSGRTDQAETDMDGDILALEDTILRLKKAIPAETLDQARVKQMQVRFKARVKREAQEVKQPFWKKWFEPQPRLQFAMAFAAVALVIVLAVFGPLSTSTGSSTSATALTPANGTFTVIALAAVLLIMFWIKRRK